MGKVNGPFAAIVHQLIDDKRVTPTMKAVYEVMVRHSNIRTHRVGITNQRIADSLGMHVNTVQKSVKALITLGYVGRLRKGSKGTSSLYEVGLTPSADNTHQGVSYPENEAPLNTHQDVCYSPDNTHQSVCLTEETSKTTDTPSTSKTDEPRYLEEPKIATVTTSEDVTDAQAVTNFAHLLGAEPTDGANDDPDMPWKSPTGWSDGSDRHPIRWKYEFTKDGKPLTVRMVRERADKDQAANIQGIRNEQGSAKRLLTDINREIELREARERGPQKDPFQQFLDCFPKKDRTEQVFQLLQATGVPPEQIIAAARRQAHAWRRENREPQYTEHPMNWIARQGWKDQLPEPTSRVGTVAE